MNRVYRFDANEVTNIKLVWSSNDLLEDIEKCKNNNNNNNGDNNINENDGNDENSGGVVTFNPEFSHKIFKEEQIMGYEPLTLNIYMGAGSLTTYIDTNYTIQSKNITNVERQLLKVMSKSDPPKSTLDSFKDYIEEKEISFKPPGELIYEFSRVDRETGEERHFEIYFGKIIDPNILRYHEKLQLFVLWYIEGGSYIFTEDSNWDIFMMFEKKMIDSTKRYGIVGYTTIYNFYHHPSTNRSRISQFHTDSFFIISKLQTLSQFLVLPPYQRMGLGKRLLNSLYDYYKSHSSVYGPVYDITVEDPGEYFILLRNSVDLENVVKSGLLKEISAEFDLSQNHKALFEKIRKELLITPVQSKTVLEIYLLSKLMNRPANDPLYKRYRIFIKKRLYKQFFGSEEEAAAAGNTDKEAADTPERKKEMEDGKKKVIIDFYEQLENDYTQTINANPLLSTAAAAAASTVTAGNK
ncbi:putative histone acetyltransferase [Heterostelium album PN500]|uniref:histone acetyltransferase n=1 Tax=Heterostelium pallidum (strain ATCC 26659 / Pp 5 / PN500) TaxID=670386 RepID=D3BPS7_HETP5|nr:putative histone acetyltransferase [Heterostelium album PN500]EFA76210.1 putative histone acetyltransferase [Heterostelium album PN500]|eukprot:XP_020428343.1 putative histone acetyltransferase [Heterostelium album PN500]